MGSTLTRKATSVGFGSKTRIPEAFSNGVGRETKLCPHSYLDADFLKRSNSEIISKAGKTFGLGWKHF